MARWVSFIVQATTAGLAAAFVLLVLFPSLLEPDRARESTSAERQPSPRERSRSGPASYSAAVRRAAPAVVNIYTSSHPPPAQDSAAEQLFGPSTRQFSEAALGSGVIVDENGYILTNDHLIRGASEIHVLLQDSRAARAAVVGRDPETDLAVLKIELDRVPAIAIDDAVSLQVGDVVLAIGNPYGVGQTVTMGIVSATGRHRLGLETTFEDYIQTDAAINPGNSGGALIDATGALVGINTAIFPGNRASDPRGSQGISFAIPVNIARKVTREIIENGYVVRGWLGAEILTLAVGAAATNGLSHAGGTLVGSVVRGSPAQLSGLAEGDVLTHINDEPIADPRTAVNVVANFSPGTEIELSVIRNGERMTLHTTVGERPHPRPIGP